MVTLKNISTSEIDLNSEDHDRFVVTFPRQWIRVRDLIKSIGCIIQPPVLVEWQEEKNYLAVCGYKRLKAAMELGWEKVETFVIEMGKYSELELLQMSICDNAGGRGFNPVEKSIALNKYLSIHDNPGQDEMEQLCGWIDIPYSARVINQYKDLELLDEDVKLALCTGTMTIHQAGLLFRLEGSDRNNVFNLFNKVKMNTNELRLFIDGVIKISRKRGYQVKHVIEKEFSHIIDDTNMGAREKFSRIFSIIHDILHPLRSKMEKEFQQVRKQMLLPGYAQISHSPYFEGNWLKLSAKITSAQKLDRLIDKLSLSDNKELLKTLFKFVNGKYKIAE